MNSLLSLQILRWCSCLLITESSRFRLACWLGGCHFCLDDVGASLKPNLWLRLWLLGRLLLLLLLYDLITSLEHCTLCGGLLSRLITTLESTSSWWWLSGGCRGGGCWFTSLDGGGVLECFGLSGRHRWLLYPTQQQ